MCRRDWINRPRSLDHYVISLNLIFNKKSFLNIRNSQIYNSVTDNYNIYQNNHPENPQNNLIDDIVHRSIHSNNRIEYYNQLFNEINQGLNSANVYEVHQRLSGINEHRIWLDGAMRELNQSSREEDLGANVA